jgi:hypothetical protein
MGPGKFADDPLAAESADAAVPFAAKRSRRSIIDAVIVYMRHACLNPQRKLHTPFAISCGHRA